MKPDIKRAWMIFAFSLGVGFQVRQFIRSHQQIGLSTFDTIGSGADTPIQAIPATSDPAPLDPGPPPEGSETTKEFGSTGQVSVDLRSEIARKIVEQSGFNGQQQQHVARNMFGAAPPPPPQDGGFVPSTFNYSLPAIPTEYNLPQPRLTNQSTVVLCFSSRENFERRAAIRETWSKGNDNVYFVIGGPVPGNEKDMNKENPLSTASLIFKEQERFGDIIDTIHPDTYRSLPYKLHYGFRWVVKHLNHVDWILKVDDDCVARVKLLQFFVLRHMNPNHPQVIGSIAVGGKPHTTGKWAEDPKFKEAVYPPWAFGSAGYVVSRPVARYVADHNELYYYQGEDAGLGIWLSESPLQVTWVDSPELRGNEGCMASLFVIGHDLNPDAIRECFRNLGDEIPERKHIIAFSAGRKDQFPGRIRNPN